MNFKDAVKGNGFLSDAGQQLVNQQFMPAIQEILNVAQSENEARILGGILSNLIGKEVANIITEQNVVGRNEKREAVIAKISTVLSDGLKKEFMHPAAIDPFDNTEKNRQAILDKSKEILNPLFLMLEGNEDNKL